MIRTLRIAFALLCATATLSLTTACSHTDDGVVRLQLGTVNAPDSLINVTSEEFARRVRERFEGRVEVTVFGSSQLGNDTTMLQKLKLRTLDFSVPSTVMSSYVPEFALFEMPYLIQDRAQMKRIGEEIFWPEIAPLAETKGYKILGLWENGFRHITNNVRPISTPADLRGIKLRTPGGDWRVRLFQVFGANPTPMPLSEVFVALQTGVIDGQENPIAQISTLKFQEVQEYLSLTSHVYSPSYLVAGLDRWNDLPEDIRAGIEQIAREIQDFAYAEGERMDTELLDQLRASGIRINQAERASFLEASQPIYREFGAEVGGGDRMIARAIALGSAPATP